MKNLKNVVESLDLFAMVDEASELGQSPIQYTSDYILFHYGLHLHHDPELSDSVEDELAYIADIGNDL